MVSTPLINKWHDISEKYGYYKDEEDTDVERVSLGGSLKHIPELSVLNECTNERLVIPLELVKHDLEQIFTSIDPDAESEPCCAWNIEGESEYCLYHLIRLKIVGEGD